MGFMQIDFMSIQNRMQSRQIDFMQTQNVMPAMQIEYANWFCTGFTQTANANPCNFIEFMGIYHKNRSCLIPTVEPKHIVLFLLQCGFCSFRKKYFRTNPTVDL